MGFETRDLLRKTSKTEKELINKVLERARKKQKQLKKGMKGGK